MTGRAKKPFLKRFLAEDTGAVTVDFVVLAATVVSLAISAGVGIQNATTTLAETTDESIASETTSDTGNSSAASSGQQSDKDQKKAKWIIS